ncbi:glycogen debranching protein GlgX [Thauera sp.]|uniref:glycogen debranching protein GlgX n=1 Tax=Thauera sp. TaxID=1905334 RepID=UPI002B799FC3|nr:glycogen debranching protein GlgX [Thauera sp.]HRP23478.1 glycogen debranching protein GlgX [Thauera sp.]
MSAPANPPCPLAAEPWPAAGPAVPAPALDDGRPWPLGASPGRQGEAEGLNFAVWAPDASALELCLFDVDGRKELHRLPLPVCSEGVWHGFLAGGGPGLVYGLRAHGPWAPQQGHWFNPAKLLLDPWAQDVVGRYGRQGPGAADDATLAAELELFRACRSDDPQAPDMRDNAGVAPKARVPAPAAPRQCPPRPQIPRARTLIYEAHVRALTRRHPDVPAALRGSYAALAHPVMLAHYRSLGITTLSLLPLHFRADEAVLQRRGLANHWGYAPIAWLAPEPRYWSGRPGTTPAGELIEAIDALHAAGLEVVVDVVFNHTAELDAAGPLLSLRGLANARAYHLTPGHAAHYQNWTGCGNSINLAEARMVELVLGALRHWATHYGVDGFRFDLATTLGRDRHGNFNHDAGLFAAIQADPQLAALKLIAEPWDIGAGGYQLGAFPAGWMEWNDQFRDTVRAWWLRGAGDRGMCAHRFAASAAQFNHGGRAPTASVNFLTAHDGFTLRDLVSFDHKHNQANGEHNRDGQHHNASWNCGVEGPTDDGAMLALRARLQRALLATLLCAQGTPMLLAGDEIGHSQQGNNNAYCQDNETSWLDWAAADHDLLACLQHLVALRTTLPALRQEAWLHGPSAAGNGRDFTVRWLAPNGDELCAEGWAEGRDRALAIHLRAPARAVAAGAHGTGLGRTSPPGEGADVLLLLNPEPSPCRFALPAHAWCCVFDNGCADGRPTAAAGNAHGAPDDAPRAICEVPGHSLLIFVASPQGADERSPPAPPAYLSGNAPPFTQHR